MEYIIKAYSSKANQTQRQVNLMSAHPTTERDAQMWANSFAQQLNQQQMLGSNDWVGQIELVQANHYRTN
jgi:hypothetical protein